MKRSKLEEYLGKKVTITLFDDSVYTGYLFKSGEAIKDEDVSLRNVLELYTKNYYFVSKRKKPIETSSCLFRCSHVTKIKEIYPLRTVFKG